MGGIWETASFALRAVGQRNQQLQVISTLSTLLLLLSQLWINAFAYVTAGRLIHCFSPTHAALGIRAIKIGQIFVGCDIISFIVQIIGGLLLMPGNNVDSIRLGLKILYGWSWVAATLHFRLLSAGLEIPLEKEERRKGIQHNL